MEYFDGMRMVDRFEQVQCFSAGELERRWAAVRGVMREQGVDLLLILEGDWEGYSQWLIGTKDASYIIVPPEGEITAVRGHCLPEKGTSAADKALRRERLASGRSLVPIHPGVRYVECLDAEDLLAHFKSGARRRIGFIHLETMRASTRDFLKGVFPGAEYVDITLAIDPVKATKSPEELRLIRNAIVLHEKVMAALPSIIRPGRTIQEINNDTAYLAHQLGSGGGVCLLFALQFGKDEAGPITTHSQIVDYPERRVERGDRVFMLLESNGIGGHFTAMGRNFILGEPSAETRRYWDLALKMQDFAAGMLRPGTCVKEIFDANIRYIESLGHKTNMQNYLHSLGYVFGERPYLHDPSETIPLRENMVYLNHPHVRIDRGGDTGRVAYDDLYAIDTYLVTPEGGKRQNAVPRELIIIE